MYKAVLFDFDGTLADDLNFFIKAYDFALGKFDVHLTKEEIPKICFHKSEEEVATNLGLPSAETFRKYYFQGIDEFINNVPLFTGTEELLSDLRKNEVRLGVITLAKGWYIEKMLEQTGLGRYFDSVVSVDDVHRPKPDPESIELSCKNLRTPPSEVLMVGDAAGDILMGNAGGAKTALFLPDVNKPYYDFEALKRTRPDVIFYNYTELRKILL